MTDVAPPMSAVAEAVVAVLRSLEPGHAPHWRWASPSGARAAQFVCRNDARATFWQIAPPAGARALEPDPDKHDDRAIALALAAHALVEQPPSRGGYAVTMAARTIGVDFGVPEPYELIRGDGSRVTADGDDWWSRNLGPYATGGGA